MKTLHRTVIILLAIAVVVAVYWILSEAGAYYLTHQLKRPHREAHSAWKPGGFWGHGLGIVGSMMVLIMLLYSIRKRIRVFRRWGKLSSWLNYHIFLGITGPILITFHTSFKFGGLVSISYWSMMAVMLSGFIGRYIYVKIPRKVSGEEYSLKEFETEHQALRIRLEKEFELTREQLTKVEELAGIDKIRKRGMWGIFTIFVMDLFSTITTRRIVKNVRKLVTIPPEQAREFRRLLKKRIKAARRIAFWKSANKLFHYWHVIHKPFAYTMIVIMIVHVVVTVSLGYTWVF